MPIRGDSGQVVGLRPPQPPQQILLVEDSYLVTKPSGLVIVGGVHPPGEERRIDPMATVELLRSGRAGATQDACRSLVRRASDGLPLIGAVPGWRGLTIAVGHGSNGFLLALVTAQAVVAQLGTGQLPAVAVACEPGRRMSAAESVVTRRAP